MAENEPAVQEQQEIPYNISIEDAGPATKKVSIEIPEELITSKLAEQFQELRREAAVPGFRPGHAPQKLIERRFQGDVRQQVARTLISQAYEQAVQKHNLQVIGEPEFDKPEDLKLPESGKLTYSFQVEVQPDITLPPLTGLKIKRVKVEVLDKHIDKAVLNLREQQGVLIPIEDRGVETGDHLFGDIHLKLDGKVIWHRHDLEIIAQPGDIFGIHIEDSDKQLKGLRPGEKREFTVRAPDNHFDENVRGKDVVVEVSLKELKRLELAEVNQDFLENLGFSSEKELRDALKEQMIERVRYDVQESMRQQVHNYLLSNVWLNLPTKLSQRQAERVVQRRQVELDDARRPGKQNPRSARSPQERRPGRGGQGTQAFLHHAEDRPGTGRGRRRGRTERADRRDRRANRPAAGKGAAGNVRRRLASESLRPDARAKGRR